MKFLFLMSLLLTLASCNKSGGGAFAGLEGEPNEPEGPQVVIDPIVISSYTPTIDPLVLTNNTSSVFGVSVTGNVGTVTYDFIKDGTETLQSSDSAFYNLLGSSLSAGPHEIKILAHNLRSSAEHVFNVRKNRPTSIVTFSPATSGVSLNCGSGSLAFSGILNDLDQDNYLVTWELDSVQVNSATPFTTVTTITPYSELIYAPDCTRAGSHTLVLKVFDGYETTEKTWSFTVNNPPTPPGAVQITSFTPIVSPVIMTYSSSTTFGVTVADGAGPVNYEFILDNTQTLQTGATSFVSILGSTLTPGFHSLKIKASNATSFAEKVFNLRKNTAPSVSTYTPALTGNNLNCSGGSMTLTAGYSDVDLDAVSVGWKVDGVLVTNATPFVTTSNGSGTSSLTYTPDCTKVGIHVFDIVLNDGYETFSQGWTVSVNNPPPPPGNVQILTFTPTNSPTVMTGTTNTTFAVSVQDGAGVVTYEFKLDNSTVLQTSTTPYFVLDGSTLSVGTHTVKVKASNSVSYDEKIFSVRRNALPSSVAYSPALSGSTVNCSAGTIVFDTTVIDPDYDSITKSWEMDGVPVANNPPMVVISSNPNYGKLEYKPDCSNTGPHTMNFKGFDGYETFTLSWSFTIVNPAQETLGNTTPSGSSLVALSTDASKSFSAKAQTGIPPYTFKWIIKRSGFPDVVKLTESNVAESAITIATTDFSFGDQSVVVTLTDSTTSNDPASPASHSWNVYKNQRPQITSVSPSSLKKVNSTTSLHLSANVSDLSDTFSSSISRGTTVCSTPSACGLSSVTLPAATGAFGANFSSGTTFIGDNTFTLNVTDSHGESSSAQFNVSANYFSQVCNDLNPGEICTLAGMPGIGDGLDLTVPSNLGKVRIHPTMMSLHDVGSSPKNMFITDNTLNVVWYWNRKSTTFQLGPYSIAPNSIRAIVGAPGFQTTISAPGSFGPATTTQLGNFFLNLPTGVTNSSTGSGSSMVTNLYIGESNAGSNGRVLRVQFDNSSSSATILTSNNVLGCQNASNTMDLAVDTTSSPNRLYAACNVNSRLSTLDLSNGTPFNTTAATAQAFTYAVANALTPFSDGPVGSAYTAQVGGLHFDNVDKVLYFTETNTCRLRVLNPTGNSTLNLFDSFSVAAGNVKTIAGGPNTTSGSGTYTWCANTTGGNYAPVAYTPSPGPASSTVSQTTQFNVPRGVVPYRLNGSLRGFFVSESANHRVTFLNQTSSTITIGNRAVAAYSSGVVFGLNNSSGAANNNGTLLGGKSSTLNTPFDIVVDGGYLFIADNGNSRIRSLTIDDNSSTIINNGIVATALGSIPKAGYNESPTLQAQNAQFNTPQAIKYDSANNRLLISDTLNYRIRSLSLSTGVVDTLVGNGSNNDQASQANPLQLNMRGPKDIDVFKYGGSEFILFADSIMGGTGANNNFIRALNSYGTIEYVLGTDVDPGKTNVVAGIIPVAPTASTITWNGNLPNYNNQPAVVVPIFNPTGLGADGPSNTIYMTANSDHCILKVDGSGIASVFAGLCGTAGTTSGNFSTVRFTNPWDIEMDTLYPGNFFVMDAPGSATSMLKYVNTSATPRSILGIIVNPYSVETISLAPGPGFANAVAVNNSQICFANGRFTGPATNQFGTQSVVCYSRSGGSGLSLYVGNRNSPGLGSPVFRGRQQRDTEDEGSPMGFGGLDEVNNPAQLSGPEGLAFDSSGNLYITEARGHAVRMVKRWY